MVSNQEWVMRTSIQFCLVGFGNHECLRLENSICLKAGLVSGPKMSLDQKCLGARNGVLNKAAQIGQFDGIFVTLKGIHRRI